MIETGEGDMRDEIITLNALARKLRAERFRNGAISFEREEAKFDLMRTASRYASTSNR